MEPRQGRGTKLQLLDSPVAFRSSSGHRVAAQHDASSRAATSTSRRAMLVDQDPRSSSRPAVSETPFAAPASDSQTCR
jgi:hypothetical protein